MLHLRVIHTFASNKDPMRIKVSSRQTDFPGSRFVSLPGFCKGYGASLPLGFLPCELGQ